MSFDQLPWNDINLLVVTDVHSWIAGHGRHPSEHLNADYGDVLSFYQHLRDEHDLFFVMNGDFMDGTGLSTIPPQHLTPILQHMPWDAVNIGNHELYFNETVQHMIDSGFIDHWEGHYLTSNTLLSGSYQFSRPQQPLGHRYTYLHSQGTSKATLLTFGFLYNFQNYCSMTVVERVQDVVQQEWFRKVLKESNKYDAILVMAREYSTVFCNQSPRNEVA
jgi:2',3'-cyclic-nucleotide 2'-phosphodiesterase (5'-nucleotidase family)